MIIPLAASNFKVLWMLKEGYGMIVFSFFIVPGISMPFPAVDAESDFWQGMLTVRGTE